MKYEGNDYPSWKDVLSWLPRKSGNGGWPLPAPVAKYFITGEVSDDVPVIAARKKLAKCKTFGPQAQKLAKDSLVNWEVLLSQFGDQKADVWNFLLENRLVGYMAMLRNLRNVLQTKPGQDVIQLMSKFLSSRDQVLRSKQLPFRFLMAHTMLGGGVKTGGGYFQQSEPVLEGVDSADLNEILAAVELASNSACENIPELPGVTAVFADNSGSMEATVSDNSKMTCAGVANTLCGIVAKRAQRGYVCAFGTDVGVVRCTKNDTVIGIANKVGAADTKGMSTNGHRCLEWLMDNDVKANRVIILSDMQCWDSGGGFYRTYEGSVANAWQKYKRFAPQAWLHSVHINGYGDNPVDPTRDNVNLVAGFSEKVFNMLLQTEGVLPEDALPTVDQIRTSHKLA
jgi:hypothetical protein